MKLKIVLERGLDGFIVASCPALRGCHSQGRTEEEALRNIREAIELFLEPTPKEIRPSRKRKIFELAL